MLSENLKEPESPANRLEGLILNNKWVVGKKLLVGAKNGYGGSGGNFSASYMVTDSQTGKTAFLKAFDFFNLLQSAVNNEDNVMEVLSRLTATYQFENMLHNICLTKRLRKIVKALDQGQVVLDNQIMHVVPFIIMEMAEGGDIRKYVQTSKEINLLMKVSYIKDVTTGLQQLHNVKIAHQDLKPSNVMVFNTEGAKIGDLGRASLLGMQQSHDSLAVAGDRNYAPPEQLYGYTPPEWIDRRQRCDLYQLGSLISFLFLGVTINSRLKQIINKNVAPLFWGGNGDSYIQALPYLESGFNSILTDFDKIQPSWLGLELKDIVKQCSHPKYELRGAKKSLEMTVPTIGLDRFVAKLNNICIKIKVYGITE